MKRLHAGVPGSHPDRSIRFCSGMFGDGPAVMTAGHARWMPDDTRVNAHGRRH